MAPRTLEEAYYVQDLMLRAIGKAGGWKVGATSPDGTPFYAPMPVDGFATSGERISQPIPKVARRRSGDRLPDGQGSMPHARLRTRGPN